MVQNERKSLMLAGAMMFEGFSRSNSIMSIALDRAKDLEAMMKTEPEGTARIIERELRGLQISRAAKTAEFVARFPFRQFTEYALQGLEAKDINTFIACSDIAIGMGQLIDQVLIADMPPGRLIDDEGSFDLIDHLVEDLKAQLKKPPRQRPIYLPATEDTRLLIEGVEMGARLYKFAYPLTE